MPDIVTFDPLNLRIIEINTGLASNELDLTEIYSEWKDWLLADSTRLRYPPAFRYVGADPISDIQNLGSTFFLNTGDGWKIRPAEYDHQLIIVGNLFTDPAGENRTTPTLGDYTVEVVYNVSNLVDSSVARLDLLALQNTVYIDVANGVAGTTGDIGSPTNPVNNIADARIIADANNLKSYTLRGTITLHQDHEEWFVKSTASEDDAVINLNGFSVDRSAFDSCELVGAGSGHVETLRCALENISGLEGDFRQTALLDNVTLPDNSVSYFHLCFSGVPGTGRPYVSFGANADAGFRSYSGGIEIRDMSAGCNLSVDMAPASVRFLASCTGGVAMIRGTGVIDDQSGGAVMITDESATPEEVWRVPSAIFDGDTGTMGGDLLAGGDVAAVADAVWEAAAADYPDPLTMGGKIIADLATIIAAGGALSPDQELQLREIWRILGLDITAPLTVSKTRRTAGPIGQTVEENVPVAGSVKVTRE